jgi:hypothetical protein
MDGDATHQPITLVLLLLDYYTVTFLTEPVTVLSCVMAVAPFARSSTTTSVDPTQRSEKPAAEPFSFPSLYRLVRVRDALVFVRVCHG